MSACRTPRLVASPAAQLLREPVFGACRYVRSAPPSSQAFETRVDDLVAGAAEQVRRDRGARDAHEQDVIEADAVEAVIQREHALDLVRLDHRGQHVAHRERERATPAAARVVRDGEDRAEVVGRMTPLGREPGVVEVEPADQRADVERGRDGIELVARARHARAAAQARRPARRGPSSFVHAGKPSARMPQPSVSMRQ